MQCKSFNGTVPCDKSAVETLFWPGKTTDACADHATGIRKLGQAMGFKVDARPIPVEPQSEGELAETMRDEIRALAEKYGKHEHLSGWAQELRDMADEIDAVIEDIEGVE